MFLLYLNLSSGSAGLHETASVLLFGSVIVIAVIAWRNSYLHSASNKVSKSFEKLLGMFALWSR